jgi:two-component system sensor histidine kinase/response regulator
MDEEQIYNLLNNKAQFTKGGKNKEEDTGLGLLLCKEMISQHNSYLSIESEKDNGSSFYFYLDSIN